MTLIDFVIGDKAEFLNAWSVWQRILGLKPTASDSFVYGQFGQIGELSAVLASTFVLAVIASLLVRLMEAK